MEEQLVRLFQDAQSSNESTRKSAEEQLRRLRSENGFGVSLTAVASHDQIPLVIRQAALLYCKTYVQAAWSPHFDEFEGNLAIKEEDKRQIRQRLLELATSDKEDRKIKNAASTAVSRIATADFPDEWPDLLPTLLHIIPNATDGQLHGALKVLLDLVDDCFNEEQFFKVARDLVRTLYDVAVNEQRKPNLRALAISVFRSCFDTLEMIMEDHKAAVKGFAEETIQGWSPFFLASLKTPLPLPPSDEEEMAHTEASEYHRGMVAMKLQIAKILMRVRSVFPAVLAPQSPQLFSATWDELNSLQSRYREMYIEDDRQSRLEDADGLPYTLDFLVLEYLDFMQACLRAPPVRKELEQQLKSTVGQNGDVSGTWITEVMKLAASYAQITTEEEGMWDLDVNVFLSEEANVTANYTPRTACGDLVIKLGEWLQVPTIDGLLAHTKTLYSGNTDWKAKEAALYLLNQLLSDYQDVERQISAEAANGYVDFIRYAMQQEDVFLRARGYLVAGSLTRTSRDALLPIATSFMESSLHAMSNDASDVVQVSCVRAMQAYLAAIPPATMLPLQPTIISSLSRFLSQQDLNELNESEDVMIAMVETLRDAILLDTRICLTGSGLDLLFTLASHGASNFQLTMLITECFEEVASTLAADGPNVYAQLCARTLPSLTGAFDVASFTEENALTNLAAEMLAVLAENGSSPLPQGFVVTVMPKLQRLLLGSEDDELLKACTIAVKSMIAHDADQMFAWQDSEGKGGLEVILIIIDRLLSPAIDDNAAAEVGGLAAELVEKAGSQRLGPYLTQLLRGVAIRLASATAAQFIQSLVFAFVRLSLISPQEVIEFLSQTQINDSNGLQVVMTKWLENSVNFAGYDEIRQNIIALSKLYELDDQRLSQIHVKGDLIVSQSNRIMTRSRARQNPDQYTIVPANLKIIKVLVDELHNASGNAQNLDPKSANLDDGDSDDDEDEDWEDEPRDFLDLGAGMTKEQLMAFGGEAGQGFSRGRDDETQAYLLQFFRAQAEKPAFAQVFQNLTGEEQEKLRSMS